MPADFGSSIYSIVPECIDSLIELSEYGGESSRHSSEYVSSILGVNASGGGWKCVYVIVIVWMSVPFQ